MRYVLVNHSVRQYCSWFVVWCTLSNQRYRYESTRYTVTLAYIVLTCVSHWYRSILNNHKKNGGRGQKTSSLWTTTAPIQSLHNFKGNISLTVNAVFKTIALFITTVYDQLNVNACFLVAFLIKLLFRSVGRPYLMPSDRHFVHVMTEKHGKTLFRKTLFRKTLLPDNTIISFPQKPEPAILMCECGSQSFRIFSDSQSQCCNCGDEFSLFEMFPESPESA